MSRLAALLLSLLASPAFAQTADVFYENRSRRNDPLELAPRPGDRSLFPPQKALPADQVKPLIDALSSKDYRAREKASRDLLASDDRVIPHLEEALANAATPEAERRLEVLLAQLKQSRTLKPTRVSVHAKNVSATAVLKDICRQAGYTFTGSAGDGARVTLDLTDVPFWEAVEKVCDPLGLQFDPTLGTDDRGGLSVGAGDVTNPHTCVRGPFRFVATNISLNRNIQLGGLNRRGGGDPSYESIYLAMNVYAEPKLPITAVGTPWLTAATDDQGKSVLEPGWEQPGVLPTNGNYRSLTQSISVGLVRGHKDATAVKTLRGVVPVRLLTEVKAELEIDDILTVKGKKFAARTCDLEVLEAAESKEGNGVAVKVVFTPRVQPANADERWWGDLPPRLALADDKGVRFVNGGAIEAISNGTTGTVTVVFTPPPERKKLKAATLSLTYWVTVQKDIEFEFKNIPLP